MVSTASRCDDARDVDGRPLGDERDVLAMLEGGRVASNITRLLLAGACLAFAWPLAAGGGLSSFVPGLAFAACAAGFMVWQLVSTPRSARTLISSGLYVTAVLVLVSAATTGVREGPFLLFLIWLVPWAFVTWSRSRALTFVGVIAAACAALLAIQGEGPEGFLREDLPPLFVGMGGLVAVGLVIRLVVDRLHDSHRAATRAAACQRLVADLARSAVEEVDGELSHEGARVLELALDADRVVRVSGCAAPRAHDPKDLVLPVDAPRGVCCSLVVSRRGRPFAAHEVAFAKSVTEVLAVAARRSAVEAERRERAGRDDLTGLAGRDRFSQALAAALGPEGPGDGAAVLVLDIDDFVAVNETLGHSAGDALLRGLASRLRSVAGDGATLARLGGDEFALLDSGISREVQAVDLAKRIQSALKLPFELEGAVQHVTAGIGIAVCRSGTDAREAIRDAHLAQRRAREQGRGRYEVFNSTLRHGLEQRRSLEQELRRALEQREFRLVYQPVVDLASGDIVGAEALLRWHHPERGVIGPCDFIDVAEATDLIVPIGGWALRHALRQLKAWDESLGGLGNFQIGVNVSARQLADGRFIPLLRRQLAKYELDPRRVTCELTETALADESTQVERAVGQLKALGVDLALDDFGTGYASLRYVRRFDFDALKLDRSFICGLDTNPDDTALVAAAISMGDALNMKVVAEGVETEPQANRLRSMGCSLAQGFLFARPMDAAALRGLLVAQRRSSARLGAAREEFVQSGARDGHTDASADPGRALQLEPPADRVDPFAR
jgi:diguanylate cyclase (GGDEF)-like protein